MRQPLQLDKNISNISCEKERADIDLEVFPVLSTGLCSLMLLLKCPPPTAKIKLELISIRPSHSSWCSSPSRVMLSTLERTQVIPSLSPAQSGAETSASAHTAHVYKISVLQFSLVIFGLVIQRQLFIYLSIH